MIGNLCNMLVFSRNRFTRIVLPAIALLSACLQSNAQTDEMLDQLIFGDDSPSLDLESPETETPPSPAAETPVSSLGEYNTGMVKWSKDFSIRVDAGYADNALLSPFKKDGSGFLRSTFEAFLLFQVLS